MGNPFVTDEKIEALAAEMEAKLLPGVAELIATRDLIVEQKAGLETKIKDLRSQAVQLQNEATALRKKGSDLAMSGGDPLSLTKKARQNEASLVDIQTWIAELEDRKAAVEPDIQAAIIALWDGLTKQFREFVNPHFEKEYNEHLRAATELRAAWLSACRLVVDNLQGPHRAPARGGKGSVNRNTFPLGIDQDLRLFAMNDQQAGLGGVF